MTGSRRGFTLVEMMLAIGVAAIALASVCGAFVSGSRIFAAAMAESELAVRTRELRDKLLFHAAPPRDGVVWSGLLAGTNRTFAAVGRTRLRIGCTALRDDFTPVAQMIDLKLDGGRIDSQDTYDAKWPVRWLKPGNLDFRVETDLTVTNAIRLNVTGSVDINGLKVEHRDWIDVPVRRK